MPLLVVILSAFFPALAWAAETPDMTATLLRTGWALLVVIGLILVLYALSKKRLFLGNLGGNAIKIVELRSLPPKSTLALVEVRGREFLLGVSADSVHLLAELPIAAEQGPADFPTLLAKQQ